MRNGQPDRILTKLCEFLPRQEVLPTATYEKRCECAAEEIAQLANIVRSEVPANTPPEISEQEEKVLRKFAGNLKVLASELISCRSAGSSNLLCSALMVAGRNPEDMRVLLDGMYWNVLNACANLPYPAELSRQMLMDALGWVYYELTCERPSSSEIGRFPAFACGMFEAIQIETPSDHLIRKTCEFITRELEARLGR
jgi:hypothetical protein